LRICKKIWSFLARILQDSASSCKNFEKIPARALARTFTSARLESCRISCRKFWINLAAMMVHPAGNYD